MWTVGIRLKLLLPSSLRRSLNRSSLKVHVMCAGLSWQLKVRETLVKLSFSTMNAVKSA